MNAVSIRLVVPVIIIKAVLCLLLVFPCAIPC